ncbi:MAG: DUF5935 domain-containing protein [Pseudomonadota bacterium]
MSFIFVNFRVPYFMALGYLWVDFLQPQRMGYYIFNQLPVAMILGAGALISYLIFDKEKRFRFSALQALIVTLVAWATIVTYGWGIVADGTYKWDWATKALLFAAFLPFVLTTRRRIEAALAVILFSISAITISAGIKTLVGGGGYGNISLLVNNNTGLYEGSTLATTSLALVPLLWWFYKHNSLMKPSRLTFLITCGLTLSFGLITIGAEARTGFVAMGMLALLIWWRSKRKFVSGMALVIVALVAVPFLPQTFIDRMSTLETVSSDKSASTRLAVWAWTLDLVADKPLGGGFHVFKINKLTINMQRTVTENGVTDVEEFTATDSARAFHSSYFEVLGELGYPGFAIWMTLVIAFFLKTRSIVRAEKRNRTNLPADSPALADSDWASSFGTAMSISVPVYMTGSLTVGIAFSPTFYHLVALTVAVVFLREEQVQVAAKSARALPKRAGIGSRRRGDDLPGAAVPAE